MKYLHLSLWCLFFIGCAGSTSKVAVDLSKYDVNNTLSTFEHEHAKATVFITTDPPGADVFMDDKYVGKANKDVVFVLPGKRVITLIKGDRFYQKTIYFKEGSNQPLKVTLPE